MKTIKIRFTADFKYAGVRFLVMEAALKHQITGYIRKRAHHTYSVIATGRPEDIKAFSDFLKGGFLGSEIESYEVIPLNFQEHQTFEIQK